MKKINLKEIQSRRNRLNITLQEMAEELGFKNASTYMKYEKGDYHFKAFHLPAIVNKLRCSIEELFFDDEFAETANKDIKAG